MPPWSKRPIMTPVRRKGSTGSGETFATPWTKAAAGKPRSTCTRNMPVISTIRPTTMRWPWASWQPIHQFRTWWPRPNWPRSFASSMPACTRKPSIRPGPSRKNDSLPVPGSATIGPWCDSTTRPEDTPKPSRTGTSTRRPGNITAAKFWRLFRKIPVSGMSITPIS